MANNNAFPLFGPRYPRFIPVDPAKSKRKWLPWGRIPPSILSLGGGESYFRLRDAAIRANHQDQRCDHQPESYPRIINGLTKVNK
jgi:hypothetical protein